MDNNVMQHARRIPSWICPPARPVELKPGGYHVMLMDLKQPLKKGEAVPINLSAAGATDKTKTIEIQARGARTRRSRRRATAR